MKTSTSGEVNGAATNGAPSLTGATPVAGPAVRTLLPTRQRRPGYTVLGVLLVLGLMAAFGYLYSTAGEKTPVVVMTAPVAVGEVLERSDLSTADVAGDITAVAGVNLESLVGQRAAVALLPGTLVQRAMVTADDPTPVGVVKVGVAVKGGQLPAEGLAPGDRAQVLRLPAASGSADPAAAPQVLVDEATVFAVLPDPVQPGGWLLTVLVPANQAPGVAAASGAGSAALVKVGTA